MKGLLFALLVAAMLFPRIYLLIDFYPVLLESDEAIVGLMGTHILNGVDFPVFFYGQHYMGALEAYVLALLFALFGVTPILLKVGPLLFFGAFLVTHYQLALRLLRQPYVALASTALVGVSPPFLTVWSLKSRGGYMSLLLFGTLALLVALQLLEKEQPGKSRLWLLGFLMGLAFWSHFGALGYGIAIATVLFFKFRSRLTVVLLFSGMGFFVGAFPVFLYNIINLGASLGRPFYRETTVAEDLYNVFAVGLPVLLGGRPLWQTQGGYIPFSDVAVTLLALSAFLVVIFRWKLNPQSGWGLILLFISAYCLLLVVSGAAQFMRQPRYLTPLYSVCYIVLLAAFRWEPVRQALVVCLLSLNILGSLKTRLDQFIDGDNRADDRQLIHFLKERDIRFSVASYWIAYRLTFETNEQHISTPPATEYVRYRPYFEAVMNARRKAYIRMVRESDEPQKPSIIASPVSASVRVGAYEVFLPD